MNMRRDSAVRLILLLAFLVCSSCAGSPPTGAIYGEVGQRVCPGPALAGQTCLPRPLAQVHVEFRPLTGGASHTAITDATGAYSIQLPAGRYEVVLRPDRRIAYDGPTVLTVIPGRPIRANFAYVNVAV